MVMATRSPAAVDVARAVRGTSWEAEKEVDR
jgi:hypothetical protein